MTTFNHIVKDPEGIHARPAGVLVKKVKELGSKVSITKDGKTVDATKLFGIMGLGVKSGNTITFTVEGDNEENTVKELTAFLQDNL